ncbi:MAG: hypothetical protein ACYTFA_19225 [Planctomycetota bacterium]|jgi:hypothetical protein
MFTATDFRLRLSVTPSWMYDICFADRRGSVSHGHVAEGEVL